MTKTPEELTADWKAGELEEGYYYIKANKTLSYVEIDYYHIFGETRYWNCNDDEDIEEVLAPVPNYEELQELKEYEKTIKSYNGMPIDYTIACETVNKMLDVKNKIKEENARLKELLKECRPYIKLYTENKKHFGFTPDSALLITKIDEVLK